MSKIRGWREEGTDVYAYFNNDAHGFAIRDAAHLLTVSGDGSPNRTASSARSRT